MSGRKGTGGRGQVCDRRGGRRDRKKIKRASNLKTLVVNEGCGTSYD
jgi:hypothetical protein